MSRSNLMANGVWANGVLAQAKLCGAKFGERRPRERALNAVTNHYQCKDGRWLILSLLNEDRQWPTLARCLGREDLITDPRFATKPDRHARSLELIKIFDEIFATKDLAEWRKILDGNGLVFGVVGILDDIPHDKQMIDERGAGAVRGRDHADRQQPDLGRRQPEGAAAASRPASASTATRCCARRATTRPRSGNCGPRARWRDGPVAAIRHARKSPQEIRNAHLPAALFPGVGKQLQARADAHPLRPELRAGLDRLRRRRDADAGVAADRQRDGRNSGAGRRRRAPDPDRADPAQARRSVSAASAAKTPRRNSRFCAGCSGTITS